MPIAKFYFPDGKFKFCHLSGKNFAIGQRGTCNRQTFHLPTANKKFAVGKCAAGHRQNSLGINGKKKFCHRQIFIFLTGNLSVCTRQLFGVLRGLFMRFKGIRPELQSIWAQKSSAEAIIFRWQDGTVF
ncbi:MAG TPA: hypothetical protein IAA30_07650 [Candidatus Treponema faecavium]|nr:hypothetical protein [Candidatus Treponema faecavium]